MCVPIAAGLAIASAAVSAAGSISQGIAARNQGNYEAKVAEQNRQLAIDASRDAIDRGDIAAVQEGRKQAQLAGQQRVALASSGVSSGFGTALDVQGDAATIAAENTSTIYANARREALGYDINAMNYQAQGAAAKARGQSAFTQGLFSATGSLLGGASQVKQIKTRGY